MEHGSMHWPWMGPLSCAPKALQPPPADIISLAVLLLPPPCGLRLGGSVLSLRSCSGLSLWRCSRRGAGCCRVLGQGGRLS